MSLSKYVQGDANIPLVWESVTEVTHRDWIVQPMVMKYPRTTGLNRAGKILDSIFKQIVPIFIFCHCILLYVI